MFCGNCGAQISDNSMFCASCGAKIETAPVQPPVNNNPGTGYGEIAAVENTFAAPIENVPEYTAPVEMPVAKPETRKEVRIVRKTSVAGIIFAVISLAMYFLPWIVVPSGSVFDDGMFFLFNVHELLDSISFVDGVAIYFQIALIAALVLAALNVLLFILYIAFEFTKKKKPVCMTIASVVSIILVLVATVAVACLGSIEAGSFDNFIADIGNIFEYYPIITIPVVVLLLTSVVGMFFTTRRAKVFVEVEIPVSVELGYEPAVPVAPESIAPVAPEMPVWNEPVVSVAPENVAPVAPEVPVWNEPVAPVQPESVAPATPEVPVWNEPVAPTAPVMPENTAHAANVDEMPAMGSRLMSTMRTKRRPEENVSAPASTQPVSTSSKFSKGGDL